MPFSLITICNLDDNITVKINLILSLIMIVILCPSETITVLQIIQWKSEWFSIICRKESLLFGSQWRSSSQLLNYSFWFFVSIRYYSSSLISEPWKFVSKHAMVYVWMTDPSVFKGISESKIWNSFSLRIARSTCIRNLAILFVSLTSWLANWLLLCKNGGRFKVTFFTSSKSSISKK